MFVFARDWRLALPLLFGPTLRCLGISLYCLLTFNFGNERTQSRHRYEITRATRSRHLYERSVLSIFEEKRNALKYLVSKKLGIFLTIKEIIVTFARSKKAIPKIVSRYIRNSVCENSEEGEFLLPCFRKIDGSLSVRGRAPNSRIFLGCPLLSRTVCVSTFYPRVCLPRVYTR